MKYLFWGILLFLGAATTALAQKNKVKLCLHDNPVLSPANQLTYYWWDPYHIHIDGKILDPDGVKKDYYLKTKPPYNYCFMLKAGPQNFKVVSIFNDSIQFNLNLQKDTTLFFQDYVKDFYKIVPDSLKLLENLKFGDNLTIHISKNYSDQFDGLRLDLVVSNDGDVKVIAVNRNPVDTNKDLINYIVFNEAFNEIESAAALLNHSAEIGYTVTIRKNQLVKEYKGENEVTKIALVLSKLKNSIVVKPK